MVDKSIYRDAYNLHTECYEHITEPDFWDKTFWPKADAITQKHNYDSFCIGLLVDIHAELERARQGGETKDGGAYDEGINGYKRGERGC